MNDLPVFTDELVNERHSPRRAFEGSVVLLGLPPFTGDVGGRFSEHLNSQTRNVERDIL